MTDGNQQLTQRKVPAVQNWHSSPGWLGSCRLENCRVGITSDISLSRLWPTEVDQKKILNAANAVGVLVADPSWAWLPGEILDTL